MLRKLLVSTALAGVLATGAYAQDSNQSGDAAAAPEGQTQEMQSEQTGSDAESSDMASSDSQSAGNFMQDLSSDQYLASNITGLSIYGSDAEDAEAVATLDNYLVGSDGQIAAAIVTTSGDEAKTVAVPFDQISWSMQDGEPRATMASGGQDLASMPTFQNPDEQQTANADGSATGEQSTDAAASGEQSGMASSDSATTDTATSGGAASETDPAAGGSSDMAASNDSASSSSDMAGSSDTPTTVGPDQYLSQNMIGADIVSGPGDDAESIGEINDLVVSSSGSVEAGVIGVGGFLGIGEKDVAVPFDQLNLSKQDDGTPEVIYASDRTQLEEAPSFSGERPDEGGEGQQSSDANGSNMSEGSGAEGTAAATGAAAGAAAGSAASEAGNEMDQAGDQAAQSADNAADETAQAANEAGNEMEQAGDQAAQSADNAADETSQAANEAGNEMDQAGDEAAQSADSQSDMQPMDDTSTLTADDMIGTSVVGPNNESVGDVRDIVLSPEGGIQAVIIDVGGFLGIGEKPVELSMDDLQFMQDSNGSMTVQTQMTEDQLENAPEYSPDESGEAQQSN